MLYASCHKIWHPQCDKKACKFANLHIIKYYNFSIISCMRKMIMLINISLSTFIPEGKLLLEFVTYFCWFFHYHLCDPLFGRWRTCVSWPSLTYHDLHKMADILQATFWNVFQCKTNIVICFIFLLNVFLMVQLTANQQLCDGFELSRQQAVTWSKNWHRSQTRTQWGNTVKPVYNDHLMGYFSAVWSSFRWPRATSSRWPRAT